MTQQPTGRQKILNSIQNQHQALLLQVDELEEANVEQVYELLQTLSQAGTIIDEAEERSLLLELIRYWSVYINSKTGEFPVVQLQPFSLSLTTSEQSVLPMVWNVPYPRNPLFIGREQLLTDLATAFQRDQAVVVSQSQAITGLGGIGKTQLALEYAYQHRGDYQAVLWAQADTYENLTSSYLTIATLLNLTGQVGQESDQTIIAVKRWLQHRSGWLLVLDNADDLLLVREFLPPFFGGHVLLTTRMQSPGRFARRLEVDVLSTEVGALFLLRRAGVLAPEASLNQAKRENQDIARAICEELGGLPLALDQAAAYIEETGCGLLGYHQLYQQHRASLLAERRGELVDDHPLSVATTWYLSFQQIEQQNPAAVDLLRLCAFLAPDAIPEEIIAGGTETLGPVLGPISSDQLRMNEIIWELLRFSLIKRNPDTNTLTIHRLVQAVTQDSMNEEMQRTWAERAIRAVHDAFPNEVNEVKTWPQCQRCLPHALACASLIEQYGLAFPEAARLLNQLGYYLREQARYPEAEKLFQQALTIREQILGNEHPDIAQSLDNLARLYFDRYMYDKAEPLYERALTIRERILEPEDVRIAQSLNRLALNYWYEDKFAEAEPLYQRALPISTKKFGPEHDQTLYIRNNLALLYRSQGKYAEAEQIFKQVLAIREQLVSREKVPGRVHLDWAQSLQNLAVLYSTVPDAKERNSHKFEEAEQLFKQALAIREQLLPAEHPQIARVLNFFGSFYELQEKNEEAEKCLKRALDIRQKVLGENNPQTIETRKKYDALLRKMSISN